MRFTEYILLALVILVPLVIAGVVTAWSIDQRRYRPKRRSPQKAADSRSRRPEDASSPPV